MISNGIDLVNITRLSDFVVKKSFMDSIFTLNELEYIKKCNNNLSTVAGLFASKEAFLKAIKKGISDYSMRDIEISHDQNNAPFIILHNQLQKDFQSSNISLSISHDGDYAIAIVSILN